MKTVEFTDVGCPELLVTRNRDFLRYYWIPTTGEVRKYGTSAVSTICKTKREVIAFILTRI